MILYIVIQSRLCYPDWRTNLVNRKISKSYLVIHNVISDAIENWFKDLRIRTGKNNKFNLPIRTIVAFHNSST